MEKFTAKLIGAAPMLMHNGRLANPMDPHAKALKAVTSKRKKLESDIEEMMKLEWFGGLYEDDEGRIAMPSDNVLSAVVEGAKKSKMGELAKAGVLAEAMWFPLQYPGPKTAKELWEDGRYLDYRRVGLRGSSVMRSRPIFRKWTLPVELLVDTTILEVQDVITALEACGRLVGLGDFTPRYGRFMVETEWKKAAA
jgi:hypothetical protein